METQSQDTTQKTRLEAARQAALGTLSRARETLQVAATTVPAWAREVETKAGEQVDALLERVGLVRIAKVASTRPSAPPEAVEPATEATEATAAAAPVEAVEEAVEATAEATAETEATAEATAETTATTGDSAPANGSGHHSSKRRRR